MTYAVRPGVQPANAKRGDRIVDVEQKSRAGAPAWEVSFGFASADGSGRFEFRVARERSFAIFKTAAGAQRAVDKWLARKNPTTPSGVVSYTYDSGPMDEVLARHPDARKLSGGKHGVMDKFYAKEEGFYEPGWSHPMAVALYKGKAVGSMVASLTGKFKGHRLDVEPSVFVLPEHRGHGIAKKLWKIVHALVLSHKRARKTQKAVYAWSPFVPPGNKSETIPVESAVANPRRNPGLSIGQRVTDVRYPSRIGIVVKRVPPGRYAVAWDGYGGRPMPVPEGYLVSGLQNPKRTRHALRNPGYWTVVVNNELLRTARAVGTFDSAADADEYARIEASRTRKFATYQVHLGAPSKYYGAVGPLYRGVH